MSDDYIQDRGSDSGRPSREYRKRNMQEESSTSANRRGSEQQREGDKREYSPPQSSSRKQMSKPASGKLAHDKLKVGEIVLKYDEPVDRKMPTAKWSLHIFKNDKQIKSIKLDRRSCYRLGRDPEVNHLILEHESCSKQHAVLQHRERVVDIGYGNFREMENLYIIDLDSTHGTKINGEAIESSRFIQIFPKDIIKFAHSSREYVLTLE